MRTPASTGTAQNTSGSRFWIRARRTGVSSRGWAADGLPVQLPGMCGAFIPVDGVVLSVFDVAASFVTAGLGEADEDVEIDGQPVRSSGRAVRRKTGQRRPRIV